MFLSYPLIPSESAVDGIMFDFCDGCRVLFPRGLGWHRVVLSDEDSGVELENLLCCDGAKFRSEIRYYVNWRIDIYRDDVLIFTHTMNLQDKEVLFTMNTDAIGDTVAWFSYVDYFQKKHHCKAGIIVSKQMRPILEENYPNITFFDRGMEKSLSPYASFLLGINYECNPKMQKRAFNSIGLRELVGCDLGFDNELDVPPPKLSGCVQSILPPQSYVCLSVNGSCGCKCMHNAEALVEVVNYLKNLGYRVLLVDKDKNELYGAEDFTGNKPLCERVQLFKDCALFIGVSSGLSWLAWASGCKVVLISGFTEPWVEFYTPYRVQNANVCHGCWNDLKRCYCDGDKKTWCPAHKDFECTRKITAKMILAQIKRALGGEQ